MNRYAAILPNGTHVLSAFPGSGVVPSVSFGGVERRLPDFLLYPTPGLVGVRECVAGVFQDKAALLWGDSGVLEVFGVTLGPYSVWVDEAGVVSWVRSPDGAVVLYSDGREPTPSRDTQHPRSRDPLGRATWAGVLVVPLGQSGPWELGEEALSPDGVTRLVAWDSAALSLAYDGYTSLPATIGAGGTVAISLPYDEHTFFVEPAAFKPYTPYVPPAVTVPSFVKVPQRCAVLVDGAPGVPWFADTGEWKDERLGVLYDTKEPQKKKASEDLARDTDRVLYVYEDGPHPIADDFDGISETVTWLPMGQCYPIKGEPDADFAERVRDTFQMLTDAYGRFAIFACGYLGIDSPEGARTEQQVVNGLGLVNRVAAEFPNCRIVVVYTHLRGASDGVARFATIQEAVKRFQASVPNAADYPTVQELSGTTPEPPITPPVDPPVPPDPPKPVPFPIEVLMAQSAVPSSAPVSNKKRPSVSLPGRWLFDLANGKILGVRFAAGGKNAFGTFEYYEAEPHEDNASTAWLWNEGDVFAFIWSDTHQAASTVVFDPKRYGL